MNEIREMRDAWEASFREQVERHAYNTAPVEAIVRNVAYWLRSRPAGVPGESLRFIEMGCGAGANLIWLAERGIRVSGIDISPTAVDLCRRNLERSGYERYVDDLIEGSVDCVPFPDRSFDGVIEACVFQHLPPIARRAAFAEVRRILKPGGIFAGHMLSNRHSLYETRRGEEHSSDPGTLTLEDGRSKIYLSNIGLAHFFSRSEFDQLLEGFSVVDPCAADYELPREEALRRGYASYRQGMWALYAIR